VRGIFILINDEIGEGRGMVALADSGFIRRAAERGGWRDATFLHNH